MNNIQLINVGRDDVEVKLYQCPYITMSLQIYNDLYTYIDHYETEVSGCGLVEKIEHKDKTEYSIVELYLPEEQDNSAASTDIDSKMVDKLMCDLIRSGKDVSKLKLHWHSHVNMGMYHSTTDEDNYKTLDNRDFLVSLVLNKKKEMLGRIDLYNPLRLSISGVEVFIAVPAVSEVSVEAQGNIVKLDNYIKENNVIMHHNYGGYYNCYNRHNFTNEDIGRNAGDGDYGEPYEYGKIGLQEKQKINVLRKSLCLSKKQAKTFKDCTKVSECDVCTDKSVCLSFTMGIQEIEEELYGANFSDRQ